MEEELLPVNCEDLSEVLPDVEEIEALNLLVTEPSRELDEEVEPGEGNIRLRVEGVPVATRDVEVAREEDEHFVREKGQLETLVEEVMPRECRHKSSDGLWLTAAFMSRLASSQIFAEGTRELPILQVLFSLPVYSSTTVLTVL